MDKKYGIKDSKRYFEQSGILDFTEIFYKIKNFVYLNYEKNIKRKKKFEFKFIGAGTFLLKSKDILLIRKFYEQNANTKETLLNNAENILGHKFSYFMLNNFYFGEKINWHKDYPNNKICKNDFYADIDLKNFEKNGDVKYIWEQNKFLHFYSLTQALLVTSQAKYAREIVFQVESWIDDNPYLMSINWTSPLEIATRLISWSWAYQSLNLINYKFDSNFEKKLLTSVYQHLDYISNHISPYFLANNHIIGEAAGLIIGGCTFNFGKNSKKWIKKGIKILEHEIKKLISEEGFSKEQSVSYHMLVFDFLLISYLFATKNGYKFSKQFMQNLYKMAKVLLDISDNEFNLPNIGDADEGTVVKFINQPNINPLLSLFSISSIIFTDERFKFKSGFDEKVLWLSGYEGIEKFLKQAKRPKTRNSIYLKDSGYYIFKDENIYGLIDVGNIGYLSGATYGHSDALSFLLGYKGKEILIDSGTFTYNSTSPWRKYFRGTYGHNTLCIDKKNQSTSDHEDFLWIEKADVNVEKIDTSDNSYYIKANHDGYLKQKLDIKHIREVYFRKDKFFVIVDKAENQTQTQHVLDLNWHFSNECDVNSLEDKFVAINNGSNVYFSIISSTKSKTFMYKGSENPKSGWISKKYDFRQVSTTLNTSIKSNKNEIFITLITFDEQSYNLKLEENKLSFDYKGSHCSMDINNIVTTCSY
ncbi:MAG: alginate lyase family protein [Candidatus Gastranaerophilaceae bacterium]|jgi:hypothetical protein